jgi:hypothetical protein
MANKATLNDYTKTTGWWFWKKTVTVSRAAERESAQRQIDAEKELLSDLKQERSEEKSNI